MAPRTVRPGPPKEGRGSWGDTKIGIKNFRQKSCWQGGLLGKGRGVGQGGQEPPLYLSDLSDQNELSGCICGKGPEIKALRTVFF